MPSEPTREELLAQVAALQLELRARTAAQPVLAQPVASPFVQEVPGVAPRTQPDKKTSQSTMQPLPTAAQYALVRGLLIEPRRIGKDTPDQILEQITALKAVMISGVNSAGYGDKRTEFRSLTELRQILNGLEEDLAGALGYGGRIRQIRMTTSWDKGL